MRTKKAMLNSVVNMSTYVVNMLLSFVITSLFLRKLGNDLYGLNGLYSSILSYLSLMELGIGVAIVFSLYKPFAEDNKEKVKGYLDYYGKFYRTIGAIVLVVGICMIPFLQFFIKGEINLLDANLYFFLILINTSMSYMFSHKLCIINVAQEGYIVSSAVTASKLVISLLQIIMFQFYPSFYIYIIIQIVVNLIYYISLNVYINKKYAWLKNVKGKIDNVEKKELLKNIKSLFMHKIGAILVFSTDNLVISGFLNLTVVGIYNSYNLVISGIQGVISSAIAGITPSIGNLLAEDKMDVAYSVHKKLFFLSFWIASFVGISLVNTLKQFVILWVGPKQVLDTFTIILIIINFYITLMRSSTERFQEASGLYYYDRYAPLIEGGINLVASILLVNFIGLAGVVLGTVISNIAIICWVKPKIVYKYLFKKPLREYFKMYFKGLLIALIPLFITYNLTSSIKLVNSIPMFILNCFINIAVINVFYLLIFWRSEEFKYFKDLVLGMLKKKFKRA